MSMCNADVVSPPRVLPVGSILSEAGHILNILEYSYTLPADNALWGKYTHFHGR